MTEEIKIGEMLKELRRSKGVSQENLAELCGVSMQAVSKWENGQSFPDITFLPKLAGYFQVTIDTLLLGKKNNEEVETDGGHCLLVPPDWEKDVLYIAQYRNGVVLTEEKWEKDKVIPVIFSEEFKKAEEGLHVSVLGDAQIDSKVPIMQVNAEADINCGDVGGNATAGACISCQDVGGSATAGAEVNCKDVSGSVNAGAGVTCADVSGSINASGKVMCTDVGGNVNCGFDIKCGDIGGNAKAGRDIHCETIGGNVEAENIH